MSRTGILLLISLTLGLTACSKAPPPPLGFANRQAFNDYLDTITMPDAWRDAVKSGTGQVSGKYLNNMAGYLKLQGEPITALCKKYGMKAEISLDGVDPAPAIAAAVRDLIAAGDSKNIYHNDYWLSNEEISNGQWDEGKNAFQQAAEFSKQRDSRQRELANTTQPDYGDVSKR